MGLDDWENALLNESVFCVSYGDQDFHVWWVKQEEYDKEYMTSVLKKFPTSVMVWDYMTANVLEGCVSLTIRFTLRYTKKSLIISWYHLQNLNVMMILFSKMIQHHHCWVSITISFSQYQINVLLGSTRFEKFSEFRSNR